MSVVNVDQSKLRGNLLTRGIANLQWPFLHSSTSLNGLVPETIAPPFVLEDCLSP